MLFVIEKNMFYANDQQHFITALQKLGKQYRLVDYVPFAHVIEPMPQVFNSTPVIALGSVNMIRTLLKSPEHRAWVYSTEQFGLKELFNRRWGLDSIMLNADGYMTTFGELTLTTPMFVRPMADLKAFAGQVVHPELVNDWKQSVLQYSMMADDELIPDSLPVWVSSPKAIMAEHRVFVVDGMPVAWSQYRRNGKVDYSPEVPGSVLNFLQVQIYGQRNMPRGYVLDIAELPGGRCRIIELNCLNSAGLYASNVVSLIRALDR